MFKLISLFVWANFAVGATFLGSVKTEFRSISMSELEKRIVSHAKNKKTFLSVGESHLEYKTAGLINFRLIEAYAKATSRKTVFCSETIGHFLDAFQRPIESMTDKTKIFERNGPYKTDFENCKGGGKNYITYSGFFHQYPFARDFPNEFRPVPVITKPGNNILSQMEKLKGLYVTQMEMEYMEFSAMRAILAAKPSVNELKKAAISLAAKASAINSRMEPILDTGNVYTSKRGVVVSGAEFDANLYGENNYFLFTNLEYRKGPGARPLKTLAGLPEPKLEAFLKRARKGVFYITSMFIGPSSQGGMGQVRYPGLSKVFEGGTFFIQSKIEGSNKLFAFERNGDRFLCFDMENDTQVKCF